MFHAKKRLVNTLLELTKIDSPSGDEKNVAKYITSRLNLIDIKNYQGYHHQGMEGGKELTAPIMTSRGCPYRCNFCSSHTVHGRRIRQYSTDRILADIRRLKEDHRIKNILVEDDLFLGNKKEVLQVLRSISQENMTIEFNSLIQLILCVHWKCKKLLKLNQYRHHINHCLLIWILYRALLLKEH